MTEDQRLNIERGAGLVSAKEAAEIRRKRREQAKATPPVKAETPARKK